MDRYYTGVGSRETPAPVCDALTIVARQLARAGYTLRSGGAPRADLAFEAGAGVRKHIYLPWRGFNGSDSSLYTFDPAVLARAKAIAAKHHPKWWQLSDAVKRLHTRNVFQVLGDDLDSPSEFVICWTRNGEIVGGTAQAIRIALTYHVPIINLGSALGHQKLKELLTRIEIV